MSLTLTTDVEHTARVAMISGKFDLNVDDALTTDVHTLDVTRLDEQQWTIGVIIGPSGAGKTTAARTAFSSELLTRHDWSEHRAIVDDFRVSVSDTVHWLTAVGLSSPPTWVRPFHTLSNGEQFRASLARALAESIQLVVVDEFTSVVDRTVAQIGSAAVAAALRREQRKQFVAVTCHYDVLDWLQPDWTYEPHIDAFTWRSVQPRPRIDATIRPVHTRRSWELFARHHYLNTKINAAARSWAVYVQGQPVAMCAVLALPSGSVKNAHRVHRIVTLPDWQGVGVGTALLAHVGALYAERDKSLYITTSHPGLTAALNRSAQWMMRRKPSRTTPNGGGRMSDKALALALALDRSSASSRLTSSFKYVP